MATQANPWSDFEVRRAHAMVYSGLPFGHAILSRLLDAPNNRGSGTTSANNSSSYRASLAASGSYYVGDSSDSEEDRIITIGDSSNSEEEDRTTTTEDSPDLEEKDRAIAIGNLVEVTSVDGLVERLRKRVRPMEQVIASIKAHQGDDDEIQAGPIKLSLRDPLTYIRISLPCRASSCVHIGCFDAICWYAMMEQTSTRLCPICDRVLDPDELIIDGFVSDILAKVHEDVDNVIIEPDGEWHTEDRTAGSVTWMLKYGTTKATKALQRPKCTAPLPRSTTLSRPSAITIGDSSESEEELREVKRGPSSPPVTIPAIRPAAPEVIDLTLSDSDEDPALRLVAREVIDLTLSDSDEGDLLPPPTQRQAIEEEDMAYILQRYGLTATAKKVTPHFTKPARSAHPKSPSIRDLEISKPVPVASTVRRANTTTALATDHPRLHKHQHTGSMDTWHCPIRRASPPFLPMHIPGTTSAIDIPEDVLDIPDTVAHPTPAARTLVGTSRPKALATHAYINTSKPLPTKPLPSTPLSSKPLPSKPLPSKPLPVLPLSSSGPSQGSGKFVMAIAHRVSVLAFKVRPLMVLTPSVGESPIDSDAEKRSS